MSAESPVYAPLRTTMISPHDSTAFRAAGTASARILIKPSETIRPRLIFVARIIGIPSSLSFGGIPRPYRIVLTSPSFVSRQSDGSGGVTELLQLFSAAAAILHSPPPPRRRMLPG